MMPCKAAVHISCLATVVVASSDYYGSSALHQSGDATAFVQSAVSTASAAQQVASALASSGWGQGVRGGLLKAAAAHLFPNFASKFHMPKYNCSAHADFMCKAPFNCDQEQDLMKGLTRFGTLANDGRANLQTWCSSSSSAYEDSLVKHCLARGDLATSAQVMYNETMGGKHGPVTSELDSSYCFMEGHCTNTEVTYNTTIEEAEKMCDHRYGHDSWAKNFGLASFGPVMNMFQTGQASQNGFHDQQITKTFAKAACAMGNYHCDVIYCRDTYCKTPYFVNKYSHLLPKTPGHLIVQRD